MDRAKQHWDILQGLNSDLASRVRQFMVIGKDGKGLLVVTEDGLAFWLGTMKFDWNETKTATEPTPLNIPELVQMAQSSSSHILLLNKRGEIYSMGRNDRGQLGLGTEDRETHFTPRLISIPQHKFISVRCGYRYSLALTEDGKVWGWGNNDCGQVGVLSSSCFISLPRQISELNLHRIVAVECGSHSLALTDLGEVYAWGMNCWGQLGNGTRLSTHIPTRISTPSPVQSIAAGSCHTLLLTQTGEVWACGWNRSGQLGLPTVIEYMVNLCKVAGLPPISQIASHHYNELSIAMSSDKRCFVWGKLRHGNLEEKLYISIFTPRKLPPIYSTVESPFSFFSPYRSTPNSIQVPETLPSPLSTRMSRMFDNPETSPDVQFVVEQRTIHAHRIILSNSSDYFARMFSERWMASVDPVDPIVKVTISDFSYLAFHALLRFFYTDSLEVSSDLLPELFELASLYLVPELQHLCLTRMRTTLTPATCCLYYPLTDRHSLLPELATFQQELVQFASTRMSEVVHSAAYHSMEPNILEIFINKVQNFSAT